MSSTNIVPEKILTIRKSAIGVVGWWLSVNLINNMDLDLDLVQAKQRNGAGLLSEVIVAVQIEMHCTHTHL